MARFFYDIRTPTAVLPDEHGEEAADTLAAHVAAVELAYEIGRALPVQLGAQECTVKVRDDKGIVACEVSIALTTTWRA